MAQLMTWPRKLTRMIADGVVLVLQWIAWILPQESDRVDSSTRIAWILPQTLTTERAQSFVFFKTGQQALAFIMLGPLTRHQ